MPENPPCPVPSGIAGASATKPHYQEVPDERKGQQSAILGIEPGDHQIPMSETDEYGLSSFVYIARAPFHPERFYQFIGSSRNGVIRARGVFWLATRPDHVGEFSQDGPVVRTAPQGFWRAATPEPQSPETPPAASAQGNGWHAAYGDRCQQLVFIGIGMDKDDLRRRLDDCLIGSDHADEVDFQALSTLPDPFSAWSPETR